MSIKQSFQPIEEKDIEIAIKNGAFSIFNYGNVDVGDEIRGFLVDKILVHFESEIIWTVLKRNGNFYEYVLPYDNEML